MFHKESWKDDFELYVGNNVEGNGRSYWSIISLQRMKRTARNMPV
jgi:hypothetical protein